MENKLGIADGAEFARAEEKISKRKALKMFETGYLDSLKAGTYESLQKIHQYLFDEIYEFARKTREVNLSKGNFRFASAVYLDAALKKIECMPQSDFDQIIEKYVEMNVAHPFREGNGRSMRIWLDKEDYLMAMERSPVKDLEIKFLLKNALTDEIHNRDVYMKGVDVNYRYEGYETYKTGELST